MKIIWADKNFNHYFLIGLNIAITIFFLSFFIYSIRANFEIEKIIFWFFLTIIPLIATIFTFKLARAKITSQGIWTGDLFIKGTMIKKSKSIFVPWYIIRKVIVKQKDIEDYKKLERWLIKRMVATTVHLPIRVKTKRGEFQFLVHNFKGFIKTMNKLGKKITII